MNIQDGYCRIWNSGHITIPKTIRNMLGIRQGDTVIILLKNQQVYIKIKEKESLENECVVGKSGRVTIPSEIRRLLQFKDVYFKVDLDHIQERTIVLVPTESA